MPGLRSGAAHVRYVSGHCLALNDEGISLPVVLSGFECELCRHRGAMTSFAPHACEFPELLLSGVIDVPRTEIFRRSTPGALDASPAR